MKRFKTKYTKVAAFTLMVCATIPSALNANNYSSQAVPSELAETRFIKSVNDSREYDTFTLDNGMEVVLISDLNLNEAAVSLSVGVGQFQDPASQLGLAHYLEHMIFQGSKNYPEPNELIKFIQANNGKFNAITELQKTTYFFSINEKQFEPALEILTDSLLNPSFDKTQSMKEINAIDAEWKRSKQQDSTAFFRTNAVTSNPNHPMVKFSTGNLETLSDKESSNVNDELRKFFNQYYSANIMKLAIVGNKPLNELKEIAQKQFSKLPNKKINRPVVTENVFNKDSLSKEIFLKTKVATDSLVLQFPLKNNYAHWYEKPNKYIEYLLSSQEEGTLANSLVKAGLVEQVSSQFLPTFFENQGMAIINIVLTESGKSQKDQIVATFFNYIDQIKANGINDQYADDFSNMLKGIFESYQNPPALNLAVKFSRDMHSIPVRDILHFDTHFSGLNKNTINNVLTQISPENLRLWHISDDQETDTELKYADGSYRIKSLKPFNLEQSIAINLPKLEIEEKEQQIEIAENITRPERVLNSDGVQAWMMNSQHFSVNQGLIGISLEGDILNKDIKHHVLTNTLLVVLSKELQKLTTRAQQRHQVYINAMQNQYGNISFTLAGKASKHEHYIQELMEEVANLDITQKKFNSAIKLYSEGLQNIDKSPLNQQAEFHYGKEMKSSAIQWDVEELISVIKEMNISDLVHFKQELLNNSYVDLFAFGKYNKESIITIANNVRSTIGKSTLKSKPLQTITYQPKAGITLNKQVNINLDNVYMKDTYVYPHKSDETSAALIVLNKIFNSAIFKSLRTEQQMAYAVGSQFSELHKHPAFTLFIESSNTDLPKIKDSFHEFFLTFYQSLKVVEDSYIEQVKTSIIEKLEQKPENIYVESGSYFGDWQESNHTFDSKTKAIKLLKRVSKQDILSTYQAMFIDGDSENIIVQLKGNKQKEQPFFDNNKIAQAN